MDFRNFIKNYMVNVYLIEHSEGYWSGGIYHPGEEVRTPFKAAYNVFTDDQLTFGESGTFTEDDRKLFTYKKLERGQTVELQEEKYTITAERDYSDKSRGLRMYVVRKAGGASV